MKIGVYKLTTETNCGDFFLCLFVIQHTTRQPPWKLWTQFSFSSKP